jgi:hypothetical protein
MPKVDAAFVVLGTGRYFSGVVICYDGNGALLANRVHRESA